MKYIFTPESYNTYLFCLNCYFFESLPAHFYMQYHSKQLFAPNTWQVFKSSYVTCFDLFTLLKKKIMYFILVHVLTMCERDLGLNPDWSITCIQHKHSSGLCCKLQWLAVATPIKEAAEWALIHYIMYFMANGWCNSTNWLWHTLTHYLACIKLKVLLFIAYICTQYSLIHSSSTLVYEDNPSWLVKWGTQFLHGFVLCKFRSNLRCAEETACVEDKNNYILIPAVFHFLLLAWCD